MNFDVVVIGSGPGGYVAAIRAAQLGKSTALVERDKFGGRCLNYACIPAKTMLHTAELYEHARGSAEVGVKVGGAELDWEALGRHRASVSARLSGGVGGLLRKNAVTVIEGEAELTDEADVRVDEVVHRAGSVILATGSVPRPIPGASFSDRIVDTWGAWSLPERPDSLVIVGAGASGVELASAYARFGTKVTLIERLDQILPSEDADVARVVARTFKAQGIEVLTGVPVTQVEVGDEGVSLRAGDREVRADFMAIAGGRAPDTAALGLGRAGVQLSEDGRIVVDERQRTSNPKVYAIGDLVHGPALAHKASEEGVIAAEAIAGAEVKPLDHRFIPRATFCHPQVAAVGLTEEQAREAGHDIKVGKMKLGGVGASAVYGDRDGLVKLVVEPRHGEILGAHVVGNRACDMIAELVAVSALEGGYEDLARLVHPHPTISEAVLDAARAVDGWATHA